MRAKLSLSAIFPRSRLRRRRARRRPSPPTGRRGRPAAPPGGSSAWNRVVPISAAMRSMNGCPKRSASPPPMIMASTSSSDLRRRQGEPERPHRLRDQAFGHRVAVLQRSFDDARGHAIAPVLGHQVEQHRAFPGGDEALGLLLHARPARVRLEVTSSAASASAALRLHDHVTDLAGGAPPPPHRAVEHHATADARADEDAEEARERPAGSAVHLAERGHRHVVVDAHGHAVETLRDRRAHRERVLHAGHVRAVRDDAVADATGRADADGRELPAGRRRLDSRAARTESTTAPATATAPSDGVGSRAWPSTSSPRTTIVWIFVPPRSTPATREPVPPSSTGFMTAA